MIKPAIYPLFLSVIILIGGCAFGPSTRETVNIFHLYNNGENKTDFCNEHIELGMSTQECVNSLTIYTRSKEACKNSVNDKSCFIRNLNRWNYLNFNMKDSLSYVVGSEFNQEAFYKGMIEQSKSFELTCLNDYDNLVPCVSGQAK